MTNEPVDGSAAGCLATGEAADGTSWEALLERSRQLAARLKEQAAETNGFSVIDAETIGRVFLTVAERVLADRERFREQQVTLAAGYARVLAATAAHCRGEAVAPVIAPAADDRRFKDEAWTRDPFFSALAQYYLLTARWLDDIVTGVDGIDEATRRKARFYLRQFLCALAPTNFVATNPKVLRATVDSGGENLRRGLERWLNDVERGRGRLRIALTDEDAFSPGMNLAVTPGRVVFENELAQLLQYTPTTETVHRRPLLIVPPWINKYYVLDLQPRNSFIRWAVAQGHTVFVLSWVNPDESLADKGFADYLQEGPLAALDAIAAATGETSVNAVGYCIGGTLLACTLAWLAARGRQPIASATFLTTLVDFSEPGELGVFIDEQQIGHLEAHMEKRGFLEGSHMAQVFSLLRENDLIWSSFINNYLLGKDPPPFDLLYWNSDATRMPRAMHSFYLREMYLHNRLIEPGALVLAGTPIDLRRIDLPTYLVAAREDHIAPWTSTFAATRHYQGPVRFVLAQSGHIAGVINPPVAGKYGYWCDGPLGVGPETWLAGARRREGSWWLDWSAWIAAMAGEQVPARQPGSGALPALEDAPGRYVRVRYDD